MTNTKQKKITNEKSVSLSPLNFKEALKGLLGVKPKKEEEKEGEKEDEKRDQ